MGVYAFQNIAVTIAGPGGFANLGNGAGVAEEGITIESAEDKNAMTIGADGQGMHSLIGSDAATITVRLLKTAPANAILQAMYDLQSISSRAWGQNIMTFVDSVRNDYTVAQAVAFKKKPTIIYAKEGGIMEWTFDSIKTTSILGAGL